MRRLNSGIRPYHGLLCLLLPTLRDGQLPANRDGTRNAGSPTVLSIGCMGADELPHAQGRVDQFDHDIRGEWTAEVVCTAHVAPPYDVGGLGAAEEHDGYLMQGPDFPDLCAHVQPAMPLEVGS
jgi:hypothetical protein